MSVQHPPREVGQVYERPGGRRVTIVDKIGCNFKFTPADTDGTDLVSNRRLAWSWTLISLAKPAVDRTGCLSPEWCGMSNSVDENNRTKDPRAIAYRISPSLGVGSDGRLFCSTACRDARVPPLAPVGDGVVNDAAAVQRMLKSAKQIWWCAACGYSQYNGAPCNCPTVVPAPAPAATPPNVVVRDHFLAGRQPVPVAKVPVCLGCRKSPCNHGYVLCDATIANWGQREPMGTTSLTEKALTERLPPARLAHSMQIEDDTLEDA